MTTLARLLTALLVAWPIAAAPLFETGDVVTAGRPGLSGSVGSVRVFRADGSLRAELPLGGFGEVRFDPDGLLAVLHENEVVYVASDGGVAKRLGVPFGSINSPLWITFGRDGSFLLGNLFGVLDFSSAGVPGKSRFPVDPVLVPPPAISGIDMSADPCILFASDSHVVALDLCARSPFPARRVLPVSGTGIRLLPDGTFITSVAGAPYRVTRYRPDGSLVRTYTPAGLVLAIDADPRFAWLEIEPGVAQRLDLDTDTLVGNRIVTGFTRIRGFAPVGEWRAGIDAPATIPTLSEWVLLALVLVLGIIALRRLA